MQLGLTKAKQVSTWCEKIMSDIEPTIIVHLLKCKVIWLQLPPRGQGMLSARA